PEHKIVLDETIYYVTGDDDDVVKITGEVVTDDDDENPVQNIRVELVQIEADEPSVIFDIDRTDKNGQFTLTLPGDAVSGVYTVLIEDDEVDIYVVPQLTTDDEMKLTWDELQADDFVFQFAGRLAFVPVEYTHVVLKGSAVKEDGGIKFSVARNGRFFVFVEADEFAKPGDLELWLSGEGDDLLLATGKIAAASIAVKLDTDAIVYDLPQTLVAEIDLSKAFPKNADWDVTGAIRTSNGKALADGHNAKVVPVVKNPSGSKYKVTFEFEDLERTDAGNYQVFIQASLDGAAYYAGTAAFSVVRPTTGKLYGMPTSTTVAEGLTLEFGQNGVHVLFRDGATYTVADYYKVSCEGVVAVDETSINLDDGNDDNDAFTAVPKQAGTVVVTIKAYRDNQYKNLLGTFTAEVEIVGGYITVEPGTVPVDSEEKVILTVVDEDEEAVNNAFIYFTDETFEEFDPEETTTTYVIDPREVNIKQGKYTVDLSDEDFEDLVALPKTWNIFAVQAGEVIAAGTLKVVGESVYDVQLDTDVVLAGLSAKLVATVTDEDGKPITPASVTVTNAKGNSQAIGSVKLSKGSAEFTVTLVTAGEYTVTVSTDSDKYLGTATFEVVLPRLELDVENVTNKVNTTLNFVLVDPLTDEILDWEISVKGDAYTTITEATLGETELPVIEDDEDPDMVELFYEDEYTLVLLVEANNVPKDKTAYVSIVAEGVTLAKLPVVGATLTADKELLVIGTPNTVTLTLTDANGKPLEGYEVEVRFLER
ncbi:MAG: carboxypeptidase-like regulatory domain-containing protein, partial [Bacillota bacterium]